MRRYRVIPYRAGSRGASELAAALGGRCLRLEGSTFRPSSQDKLINWGNSEPPFSDRALNGRGIRNASNKREFFTRLASAGHGEIIPAFWTRRQDIPSDSYPIVCRTVLAGHSGEGIVIADDPSQLVDAPLYVKYIKKQDEYRVHVGMRNGTAVVIDVQQKRRRNEHADPDWRVRNLANGFIYAREGVDPPDSVLEYAKRALAASGLDFGAVDVIYNARENRAYVLEVNTAPGITGTTVERYVDYFRRL